MLLLLLATACQLGSPAPQPITLGIPVMPAAHSRALAAEDLLWPQAELTEPEQRTVCEALDPAPEVTEPHAQTQTLLATKRLGFALIEVSPAAISVDGQAVVSLQQATVPSQELKGELIAPLYTVLSQRADALKRLHTSCPGSSFAGDIALAVDAAVPYQTLSRVLFTAGQAEFSQHHFLANSTPSKPMRQSETPPAGRLVRVELADAATLIVNSQRYPDLAAAQVDHTLGCAVVLPGPDTRYASLHQTLSGLLKADVEQILIGRGSTPGDLPKKVPASPLQFTVTDTLAVLPVQLPSLRPSPPGADPLPECVMGDLTQLQ